MDWAVNCINGMEFDEYDNEHTTYVFGIHNDNVLCSVRFIETRYPNMISHTFAPWFDKVELPQGNYIESSRFSSIKIAPAVRNSINILLATCCFWRW